MGVGRLLKPLKGVIFRLEEQYPRLAVRRQLRDFPSFFQIQTTSYCQADCVICPYPDTSQELPMGRMSDELFCKIIDECAHHPVKYIDLFLMNEPFLDKKMPERLAYIKEKLPDVGIQLDSNMGVLPEGTAEAVVRHVDVLLMSCHGITKESAEAVMPKVQFEDVTANVEKLMSTPGIERVVATMHCVRTPDSPPSHEIRAFWEKRGLKVHISEPVTRAGNLRADSIGTPKEVGGGRGCWNTDFPLNRVNILYNGDAILCCMDWRREHVLGNVGETSIEEIWNGEAYRNARDQIYGDADMPEDHLCRRCENPDPTGRFRKYW